MRDALLKLLQSNPATAGRPDDFLDTLADDIQAVIIRAVTPALTDADQTSELEHQVDDIFNDHFGVRLCNLYSIEPFLGKKKLYFSARKRVVKSMIKAMLVEQADLFDRDTLLDKYAPALTVH